MFSPGGFDATLEKWATQSIYARIKLLDHLPERYTCIVFDRRETGQSGGRVERITWAHYVEQGKGLLDHLNIQRAHIMGACMGCGPAAAFAVAHPATTLSLLLYWPVGGAKYRLNGHLRFAQHLAYVHQQRPGRGGRTLKREAKTFGEDPRGGPWASVIRRDAAFADAYARHDAAEVQADRGWMGRIVFDRDTVPGAEPEDLMGLDIPRVDCPGRRRSVARNFSGPYLAECLPHAEYWDVRGRQSDRSRAVGPRSCASRILDQALRVARTCVPANSSSTANGRERIPCSTLCRTTASSTARFGSIP